MMLRSNPPQLKCQSGGISLLQEQLPHSAEDPDAPTLSCNWAIINLAARSARSVVRAFSNSSPDRFVEHWPVWSTASLCRSGSWSDKSSHRRPEAPNSIELSPPRPHAGRSRRGDRTGPAPLSTRGRPLSARSPPGRHVCSSTRPFSDRLPAGIESSCRFRLPRNLASPGVPPQYRHHSITSYARPSCGLPRLVASIGYIANPCESSGNRTLALRTSYGVPALSDRRPRPLCHSVRPKNNTSCVSPLSVLAYRVLVRAPQPPAAPGHQDRPHRRSVPRQPHRGDHRRDDAQPCSCRAYASSTAGAVVVSPSVLHSRPVIRSVKAPPVSRYTGGCRSGRSVEQPRRPLPAPSRRQPRARALHRPRPGGSAPGRGPARQPTAPRGGHRRSKSGVASDPLPMKSSASRRLPAPGPRLSALKSGDRARRYRRCLLEGELAVHHRRREA